VRSIALKGALECTTDVGLRINGPKHKQQQKKKKRKKEKGTKTKIKTEKN
jgi:hypothetical protein